MSSRLPLFLRVKPTSGEVLVRILNTLYPERSVRIVVAVLLCIQILLVIFHSGGMVLYKVAPSEVTAIVREFFGLSNEGNAPTWFSSLQLTLIAFACAAMYWAERRRTSTSKHRIAWLGFGLLFLSLSFDETAQFHERLDWVMSGGRPSDDVSAGDGANGPLFYRYLIVYLPILGTLGVVMARFVAARFEHRPTVALFLAGMACLATKLAFESVEKWSLSTVWFGHHVIVEAVIAEMSFLFLGATLILTALLNHLFTLVKSSPASLRVSGP